MKIHQYAILCAPTNSQYAAIEGLKNCDDEIQKMRTAYNERRRYLMHTFKEMGLRCFEPFGAFYVFPNIQEFGMTSENLRRNCFERRRSQLFREVHLVQVEKDISEFPTHIHWTI